MCFMLAANNETVNRYLKDYGTLNSLSDARIRTIRGTLAELDADTGEPFPTLGEQDLRDWVTGLAGKGQMPSTIQKKVKVLRTFFRWLNHRGEHAGIDWSTVRGPRVPKQKPRPYSNHDLKRFWDDLAATYPLEDRDWYLDRFRSGQAQFRRVEAHTRHLMIRALVRIIIAAGPRRTELYRMTVDDLHWENEYIMIPSVKGGKPRIGPHTNQSREAVRDWLEWREQMFMSPQNPGIKDHGRPWLSASRFTPGKGEWLRPIGQRSWMSLLHLNGENWSMHRFRHTCGTQWARRGMDLGKLQILMGHANIQQTLGYAELTGDDVIRAARTLERESAATF